MDRTPSAVQIKHFVAFRIAEQWHDIGIQLHFTTEELDDIDKNCKPVSIKECCKTMLYLWTKKNTPITAEQLIRAIEEAGHLHYALELQKGTVFVGTTSNGYLIITFFPNSQNTLIEQSLCTISYSTVVLYIGIMKVWGFGPKLSPLNQLDICFPTVWEYWLGIAKPKSVFRSTLNRCIKLLWNFKNFLFIRFFC